MNKCDYCQQLFEDIKDNIELDSDIVALKSLLLTLLDYDQDISVESWKYIILKYDIKNMANELDFIPIIKSYPEKLMQNAGIEKFFLYMKNIPVSKLKIIYETVFNVYSADCFIYQLLSYYIKMNLRNEEKHLIKSILDKSSSFSKIFFDKTELIKKVIILHIENNNICIDYLKELINIVDNKKDRAVLKTLLIDYLMF